MACPATCWGNKTDISVDRPIYAAACDCKLCRSQFYDNHQQTHEQWQYGLNFSDSAARETLAAQISELQDDWLTVKNQVERYGDYILHRWKKRSQQKRIDILLEAYPQIRQNKCFDGCPRPNDDWWGDLAPRRTALVLPYLNIETLNQNPLAFVHLLHVRTSQTPQQIATFDNDLIDWPWRLGYLFPMFNRNAVSMLENGYGDFVTWNNAMSHQGDIIGFPRGQLLIEAQNFIMRFLRRAVYLLLSNATLEQPFATEKWNVLIAKGFRIRPSISSGLMFLDRPCFQPPQADLNSMIAQARARMEAMEDHLWLLQTEPAYLRRQVSLIRLNKIIQQLPKRDSFNRTAYLLTLDVDVHWFWQDMLHELEYLRRVYSQHGDSVHTGSLLPSEVADALAGVEALAVAGLHTYQEVLKDMLPQRPAFQEHFVDFSSGAHRRGIGLGEYMPKPDFLTECFESRSLFWCLAQLIVPTNDPMVFNTSMIFSTLDDHLMQSGSSVRQQVDHLLLDLLSNYAALSELHTSIKLLRPQSPDRMKSTNELDIAQRGTGRMLKYKKCPSRFGCSLGKYLENFYVTALPSGRQDQNWLRGFNEAHERMQNFWIKAGCTYACALESWRVLPEDAEGYMQSLMFSRNAKYHEGLEEKRCKVIEGIARSRAQYEDDVFFPLPSTDSDLPRPKIQEPAVKVKTRGVPLPPPSQAKAAPAQDEQRAPRLLVPTKRAAAIVRQMFPLARDESQSSISWDVFLNFMSDMGFVARNGSGSIVAFEDKGGKGRIIFHRPHPEPELDPIMLHSMGRRMNKWFGWKREMFALEGK